MLRFYIFYLIKRQTWANTYKWKITLIKRKVGFKPTATGIEQWKRKCSHVFAVLPCLKIAHDLFLDFTKGDASQSKSEPEEDFFFPAVCIVSIDHRWISCGFCWPIHMVPCVLWNKFPWFPYLSMGTWERGSDWTDYNLSPLQCLR